MDQDKIDTQIEDKASETAAEEAAQEKRPKGGILRTWFNPETRFGRFNRLATRWVAIVLVLFAAGLLVGYFALVKPAQTEILNLKTDLRNSQSKLANSEGSLDSKTRAFNDASLRIEDISQELQNATQHIALLKLVNKVQSGRVELANNVQAEARKKLLEARVALLDFAPALQVYEKDLDKTLLARLDLALSEMEQDPKTAAADLNILSTYLLDLEGRLFPVP